MNIQIWDRKTKIASLLAIDTETTITPSFTITPEMVLGSVHGGGDTAYILRKEDVKVFFEVHRASTFILQNAPFDMDVLKKIEPSFNPYTLYDSSRVMDVGILYRLWHLATKGWVPKRHSMKVMAKELLDIEIDKSVEERVTFGQFLDTAVEDIPDSYLSYAAQDAVITYKLYFKLRQMIGAIPNIKTNQLLSHHIQVKGDLALNHIYKRGIAFDVKRRNRWLNAANKRLDKLQNRLATWGWVRGKKGNQEVFESVVNMLGFGSLLPRTEDGHISSKADDLTPYKSDFEFIQDYLAYNELEKVASFVQDQDQERIHPRYDTLKNTGRTGCIAEGELVSCLGGMKPIEDVEVGDYVYSYTDNNKLELKKVVNTMKQGRKKTIKIHWKSLGNHKKGTLICTPDHEIKVRELSNPYVKQGNKKAGWYRADELVVGDRLVHMTYSTKGARPRVYGVDVSGIQEQLLIKEQVFGCTDHKVYDIHHIDHNNSNNDLSNLEVMTKEDHYRYHHTGNTYAKGINKRTKFFSYEELYSMYKEWYYSGDRCIKVYSKIKRECRLSKIKLSSISRHFKHGKEITLEMLIKSATMKTAEAERYTTLDFRTWKKALAFHDISINHTITSIEAGEEVETYDLEVEDNHNFIVSEICVHNCAKPNIQNLPRKGMIRSMYTAKKGHTLLIIDYNAIELACLGQVCLSLYGKSEMARLINEGECLHYNTAVSVYRKPKKDILKDERQFAKIPNFAFPTNMKPETFVDYCKQYDIEITPQRANDVKESWSNTYPEIKRFWTEPGYGATDHTTLSGRIRANAFYTAYLNTFFQGMAADGAKLALYEADKAGLDVVAFVHDELVFEVEDGRVDEMIPICEKVMIEGMKKVVTDVKVAVETTISKRYCK